MPRVLQRERLDDAGPNEAARSLRDLDRINRWFGGNRVLAKKLRPYLRRKPDATILDVGAGSGQTIAWLATRFSAARFIALDRSHGFLERGAGSRIAADAIRWPVREKSVDIVISTLMLHHLDDAQVAVALQNFSSAARIAVIAVDLERNALAKRFLPATKWLFRWDPMTIHDGLLSFAAAFTRNELQSLAPHAAVEHHAPWCRLSLVIEATHPAR